MDFPATAPSDRKARGLKPPIVRTAGIVDRRAAATPRNIPPMLVSSIKVSVFAGCPEVDVEGVSAGVAVGFDASIVEHVVHMIVFKLPKSLLSSLRILDSKASCTVHNFLGASRQTM